MRKPVTVCNICGKQFENGKQVRAHKSIHSKKVFTCKICNEIIVGAASYKMHLGNHKLQEKNEQKCKCTKCNKEFNSKAAMYGHMSIHSKKNSNKKIKCIHCNNEFIKYDYIKHIQQVINFSNEYMIYFKNHDTYINKYYVKCPICNIDKFDLTNHLQDSHNLSIIEFQNKFPNNIIKIDSDIKININFQFNKIPKKDEHNLNLLYARGIMNHKEEIINSISPENVIFSDTMYYLSKTINGKKIVKNPDFIIVNPQYIDVIKNDIEKHNKILLKHYKYIIGLIEHFGDYWHGPKVTGKSNIEHENEIKQFYSLFNKNCLIIWEHELNDIDKVKIKINNFIKSL